VKWYRLAAEQGHTEAQNDLGAMCRDGSGAPQGYNAVSKANGGPKPSVAALDALYTG
jgi:TPR repeat protein